MLLIGRRVGGLVAIALGALMLWWGDVSEPFHTIPIDMPARAVLAYIAALVLILAGAGLVVERTAKASSVVLAALFAAISLIKVWKIVKLPADFHSWTDFAEQSSIMAGYLAVFATMMRRNSIDTQRLAIATRVWWGCCALSFGAAHFVYLTRCASFVPSWIPGPIFWSVATGFAHMAAGIGVLTGIWALPAARLATVMYATFGLLVWGNLLALHPADHASWSGLVVDFVLAAGALMVGDVLRVFPPPDGKLFALQDRLTSRSRFA